MIPSSLRKATISKQSALPLASALMAQDIASVDALILERVAQEIPLIKDITQHIVASGGKRLRPMLTLLSAKLCGYSGSRHIGLAAAVEFIHTATLLHDDVVDESSLRRGLSTANEVWGNKASILVGDFLFSQSFRLMVADQSLEVLDILSAAAATISRGEVMQMMTQGELSTSVDQHLQVVEAKTAALFSAACELGAVVSDNPQLRDPLKQFGHLVGIAFQLVDDALDYMAAEAQLGKTVGDDFREGKLTLPVIYAYQDADKEEQSFWLRTIAEHNQQEQDLGHALALMQKHKSVEKTFDLAKQYCQKAQEFLAPFPACPTKDAMIEIVDFCLERMY